MENIKLSSRDKPGHHHRSIGNLPVLLPSHRQTSHHSHRQRLTLTIGTNTSPLLDLVTFNYLFIGNHPHRQLPCRPVTVAPSCRSILYQSLGTCPKTVSTGFHLIDFHEFWCLSISGGGYQEIRRKGPHVGFT